MVKPTSISVDLTEPVVFLRGPTTGEDARGRRTALREDVPPALLRGLLTMRLAKPTRIKSIQVVLEGKARTEWPEGIGPRRTEVSEEHIIFESTVDFFNAARSSSRARRAQSLGPATFTDFDYDGEDDELGLVQETGVIDSQLHSDNSLGLDRGRVRDPRVPRSQSVMHESTGGSGRTPSLSYARGRNLNNVAIDSSIRGPSPAYTPIATVYSGMSHINHQPATHSPLSSSPERQQALSEALAQAGLAPSAPAPSTTTSPLPGRSVLSPIASAYPSAENSRDNSTEGTSGTMGSTPDMKRGLSVDGTPVNGSIPESPQLRYPIRPATEDNPEAPSSSAFSQLSLGSASSSSLSVNEQDISASRSRSATPQSGTRQTAHPTHFRELPVDSNLPSPSVSILNGTRGATPPISRRSSAQQVATSDPSSPIYERTESPGSSPVPSRRSSRDYSVNAPSGLRSSSASIRQESIAEEDPRGRRGMSKTRFGFGSVGKALRGLSQDVKERVAPSAHAGSSMLNEGSTDQQYGAIERVRGRRTSPSRFDTGKSRSGSRSRGRTPGMKVLTGSNGDEAEDDEFTWKEFKKGIYHYPVSFTIPVATPPSIHADFGSVVYRLKAVVHRAGALNPNLTDEKEVRMVACPGEDDTEESENVIVERQWEEELRYLVALSGKSFPIGGQIPLSIRLMPLNKTKIYRISVLLEEKIDYYAHDKKVARHEATRRYQLLALKYAGKQQIPLLPINSEAPDALIDSPVAPLAVQGAATGDDADDALSSLLNPTGPWLLDDTLKVPDCSSRIHFTTKHTNTNITIGHTIKVIFRVERGADDVDAKGKRKQFDIIIETPITLLDCRCNTKYIMLPSYALASSGDEVDLTTSTCTCKTAAEQASSNARHEIVVLPSLPNSQHTLTQPAASGSHGPVPTLPGTSSRPGSAHHSPSPAPHHSLEDREAAAERRAQFARLVSGEETSLGEVPPTYDEAVNHPRSRSQSRATPAITNKSRSRSRPAVGSSQRLASPMPPFERTSSS